MASSSSSEVRGTVTASEKTCDDGSQEKNNGGAPTLSKTTTPRQPQHHSHHSNDAIHKTMNDDQHLSFFFEDDDDDEEDFIVISSRQELLDSIISEYDDDDDIIVIRSSSSSIVGDTHPNGTQQRHPTSSSILSSVIIISSLLVILLSWWYMFPSKMKATTKKNDNKSYSAHGETESITSPKRKLANQENAHTRLQRDSDAGSSRKSKRAKQQQQQQQQQQDSSRTIPIQPHPNEEEEQTRRVDNNNNNPKSTSRDRSGDSMELSKMATKIFEEVTASTVTPNLVEEEEQQRREQVTSQVLESQAMEPTTVLQSSTTMMAAKTETTQMDLVSSTTTTTITSSSGPNEQERKLSLAREIAKDIKLVEDVFHDEGISTTNNTAKMMAATQIAIGWHSSERIIQNQNQIEYQKLQYHSFHKELDRQLSQRQHEELVDVTTASSMNHQFDPNWNEKLQLKRDACWNILQKLCWEMGLAYLLVQRVIIPLTLLWRITFLGAPSRNDNGNQEDLSINNVLWFIMSNVCNCNNQIEDTFISILPQTTSASYLFQYFGLDAYSTMFDSSVCYGNCVLSTFLITSFIGIAHRILKLFAVPTSFHHLVNGIALLTCSGLPFIDIDHWSSSSSSATTDGSASILYEHRKWMLLGVCILGMFGVVQWNYKRCQMYFENDLQRRKQQLGRRRNSSSASSVSERPQHENEGEEIPFQKKFRTSLQRMDTMQWMLNAFRCMMLVGICFSGYSQTKKNQVVFP